MNKPALLGLEDGSMFHGISIGVDGMRTGEVVFNTAMTGYQEIVTDPSYARQFVTLTCPHIGNVGANAEDTESGGVFCAGLIVKNVPDQHSNWRSEQSLAEFLTQHQVVAMAGIDTRRLTRLIRTKGALRACLHAGGDANPEAIRAAAADFPGLEGMDLAREVSVTEPYTWHDGEWGLRLDSEARWHVVAYDFGVKHNILRLLRQRGCRITVVPATTPADEVLALQPNGVFLSNGPGDPEPCDYAIRAISTLLERRIPTFGICLGHQLLALASGAATEKMKFGHHGANHPVKEVTSDRVIITSQNHGFTVSEQHIPPTLRVTHRSLFDGTIQGLERVDRPAFSFQGHPEASPGPHDIRYLFDRFITMMEQAGCHA